MKYIITYSNSIIDIPDGKYKEISKIISDPKNRFIVINGMTYNINDFKYAGDKKNAPVIDGWNNMPVEENAFQDIGFNQYYLKGDVTRIESRLPKRNGLIWGKYTSDQFRELAKKVKQDHVNRMTNEGGKY
jgi:hypothetical protein